MKFISAKDIPEKRESDMELPEEDASAAEKRKRREKSPPSAQTTALRLLSLGDHSSLQLREKLSKRGFSADEIEDTIVFLREKRFLNDLRYGENLIHYMAERKYFGAYKIRMELARKLDREYIDALLPDALEEYDFAALAREFAEKPQNRGKSREQMIRRLKANGYAPREIRFAVNGREIQED